MAETIKTNENKDSKLVFKAQIARQLLRLGNKVIDIKADKSDHRRSVFVFENDEKFQNDFNQILNDLQDERQRERKKKEKKDNITVIKEG